jgi:SAM-dependent methyltransferase
MMTKTDACSVCFGHALEVGSVDFNKSCEEVHGKRLPPSGLPVRYLRCTNCGFCFAPDIRTWTASEFRTRIYNEGYSYVDPDSVEARPRQCADLLQRILGDQGADVRHLDYGGGKGLLSALLLDAGWQSASFDPFFDPGSSHSDYGVFDLITAFEVFEHVPDPHALMTALRRFLEVDGLILFSTLLSEGNMQPGHELDWWYAAPRNGHISLYTANSLRLLGKQHGLAFGSFGANFHAYWRQPATWFEKLLSQASWTPSQV